MISMKTYSPQQMEEHVMKGLAVRCSVLTAMLETHALVLMLYSSSVLPPQDTSR
jgi:hypothetical protein